MEVVERDKSFNNCDERSGNDHSVSLSSSTLYDSLSSITRISNEKNSLALLDVSIASDTEMRVITDIWVHIFKNDPKSGTVKLFTVLMNCFEVDVCDTTFTDFNPVSMFARIVQCFETLANTGLLISPETVNRSPDIQKTLEFITSIFRYHNDLFFSNDTCKSYFMFLTVILNKISQSHYIGPRLLSTSFGLKIVTGLIQSNNSTIIRDNIVILIKDFLIRRWKDTVCRVREIVLLELQLWIQIDPVRFLNDFWMYIYWALGDHSTSIQNIALAISKNVLNNMHDNLPNVKLLRRKIVIVLPNLLLSKNEDMAISALNLYSILTSVQEEDEELCMSSVDSIALELMFSDNSKVASVAAEYFVNQIVNSQQDVSDQLKVILSILSGIPSYMTSIATSFFVEAIYNLCPLLTDFKLISQLLTLENYIKDKDKHNLMVLLMYIIKWLITGISPKHRSANIGDQNNAIQLHINTFKKKEYTTYLLLHLINQLKECTDYTHAFSLWILLQFSDFKLLQDKMIIPEIVLHACSFYQNWNIPTILEMISKCLHIMTSTLRGHELNICFKCINDSAQVNIDILKAGIENSFDSTPSILIQKHALIKIWSIAKYNCIPDDLESLKYLSHYVPYLNDTQKDDLIVSEYALYAYMEILRKKLLNTFSNSPNNTSVQDDIEHSSTDTIENTFFTFLDAMFNILMKYDHRILNICETAFLIIDELLRITHYMKNINYALDSDKNVMVTNFMFSLCKNYKKNNLNTLKIIKIYMKLIQDCIFDINHLITLLQFVQVESFERALRPIFNFLCNKKTGNQLSSVINLYLVYMFENVITQKTDFENSTIKDVINVATIISRILCQCTDQVGKRLVSTNIHRNGIEYAMTDTLNNPCGDYPFKQFFWVLTSMCNILISYDARRLAEYFLKKPTVQELITIENEHVLQYLFQLQEICNANMESFCDAAE